VRQAIIERLEAKIARELGGVGFTTTSNAATEEPLTLEKLQECVDRLNAPFPSCKALDDWLEKNGKNPQNKILLFHGHPRREFTIQTKYGPLKAIGSPYNPVEDVFLLDTGVMGCNLMAGVMP
jgi:hypothetical protein